jgi:hypothetical protein
LGWRL